jgi:hypothetical protein
VSHVGPPGRISTLRHYVHGWHIDAIAERLKA